MADDNLYNKYRPKRLEDVVGQPDAVRVLAAFAAKGKFPAAMCFVGPSGTGKSTLAAIVARTLGCTTDDAVHTLDAAQDRGIATVREIRDSLRYTPLTQSGKKVWVFEEAHRFTRDSQEALLLTLEHSKPCFHFILTSTEPDKILATVRNRCTVVRLTPVGSSPMTGLIKDVARKEGRQIEMKTVVALVDAADGSPRRALVLLEKVIDLDPKEQVNAVEKSDLKHQAIELARALIDTGTTWKSVAPILKSLEGEDVEKLRRMVLGYCRGLMVNSPTNPKINLCACIIDYFRDPWYDVGEAGLAISCFKVLERRSRK